MRPALREVVALLQAHDAAGALAALDALRDLTPDEAAHAHAWRAQALRAVGRVEEAAREVSHALRHAKGVADSDGVTALRALHTEIYASIANLRLAEAGRQADAALALTPDAELDAEGLLRKAIALLDAADPEAAERVTRLALARALAPREVVLTHLALARLTLDPALVHAAHRAADAADDHNLLTAVAQAARALGIRFAPPTFG